jgi:CRP-like cAMP-binding protein
MSLWEQAKSRLNSLVKTRDSEKIQGAVSTLRSVPVFKDLSGRALRHLGRAVHYRDFKIDEFVYHQGDPGLGVYIVQHGHVQLLAELDDGQEVVVRDVREGEFFGERSLVHDVHRDVSARVVSDSRLLGFFRPDLRMLYRRQPQVGMMVVLAFGAHLVDEYDRLVKQVGELERALREDEDHGAGTED